MKIGLKILSGISWITGKLKVIEKTTQTVSAFVKCVELFEQETKTIWKNEKQNKKDDNVDAVTVAVDTDSNTEPKKVE